MSTEFSTVGRLEVEVDERSLSRAESEISERMGSVRPTVETDGGTSRAGSLAPGRGGGGSIGGIDNPTALLSAQLEKLEDIHETIEKMAVSSGGGDDGGGGGLLAGVGARALLGTAAGSGAATAAGGGAVLGGAFGANAKWGSRSNTEVVGRSIAQSGGNPAAAAAQAGSQIGRSLGAGDLGQQIADSITAELANADLPTLQLPSREEVRGLVLGLPGNVPALNLPSSVPKLGLPDSIPALDPPDSVPTLSPPAPGDLPVLDITKDLPALDVDAPDWLRNLDLGGGGGDVQVPDLFGNSNGILSDLLGGELGRGGNNGTRTNSAAQRSRGGDANVTLDVTAEGMDRREVEQAIDDAVEDAKQDLRDAFGS